SPVSCLIDRLQVESPQIGANETSQQPGAKPVHNLSRPAVACATWNSRHQAGSSVDTQAFIKFSGCRAAGVA
ncbi:MAG: hypothetical protein ACO3FE_20080, partial [Planctomycetaceae bacterium]